MQVVVHSLLTRYVVQGQGKTVLLLHGWGDSSAGFARLQKELATRYQVIAVDLPGFGGTQAPPQAWGLNDYAHFVHAFLKKIDATEVWGIIAHSNGGAIAIRGLGKEWLRAERVVLLATAGIRGEYKGRLKVLRLIAKAGKALVMPLPASVKKRLRRTLYTTVGSDMLVAEHLQETFKKVVTDDVRTDAAKLTMPVLLVYGEQDINTPIRYGEMFHQIIPHSTLEIMAGAEHFVHHDKPLEVKKAVEDFLK